MHKLSAYLREEAHSERKGRRGIYTLLILLKVNQNVFNMKV